ncbi:4Fe-4S dicluster domain-containing protein [Flavisphingomonas formosensis]|uniref:4Fe-4S dicluster domain-containing protein n=1 Tax=Flavisphingomonas formosensis TaxID=861534 RepID=UPI0012F7DCE9|nr:ferredoxin family protein [Sphingomonas formosensis]
MTYVIVEACRSEKAASCVRVCPVDCIRPTTDDAEFNETEQLYIDPDACIDCGACVAECPVDAIYADHQLPAGMEHMIAVNAAHFRK